MIYLLYIIRNLFLSIPPSALPPPHPSLILTFTLLLSFSLKNSHITSQIFTLLFVHDFLNKCMSVYIYVRLYMCMDVSKNSFTIPCHLPEYNFSIYNNIIFIHYFNVLRIYINFLLNIILFHIFLFLLLFLYIISKHNSTGGVNSYYSSFTLLALCKPP